MAILPVAMDTNSWLQSESTFCATSEYTISGSSETPIFMIKNPTGSGKLMKILSLDLTNIHTVVSFIRFRLYKSPTVSNNGSTVYPYSTHLGGLGSSVMQVYSAPTVSANGTKMGTWASPGGTASEPVRVPFNIDLTLDPGQTLLITGHADGTNRVSAINAWWQEI